MDEKKFDHLFLIGHIGAGKTYHSKILKERLNMPIFSIDLFRFIRSEEAIKREIKELEEDIKILKSYKNSSIMNIMNLSRRGQTPLEEKEKQLALDYRLLELHKLAPHARNLIQLGYNKDYSKSLSTKFYYLDRQKMALLYNQFYINKMTNEILDDLTTPCIIDASGGQFINFDYVKEITYIYHEYLKKNHLENKIENFPQELKDLYALYKNEELAKEREKAFSAIKSIGNVVYFYQDHDLIFTEKNKASGVYVNHMITKEKYKQDTIDNLHPLFINTTGIFNDLEVDKGRVEDDIEEIVKYYKK